MAELPQETDVLAEGRYQALLQLTPTSEAVPRLVSALHDASWRVRKLAAERLAHVEPTPELVEHLVAVLAQRDETGARNAAAAALAQLGPGVLPALVRLLAHPDPDQRKFAADILGELRQSEAAPALIAALADSDPNVRAAVAEALGRVGGPEAGRALEALLEAPDVLLRVCALEGLFALQRPPPLPALLPLLQASATRRSAYRVLGLIPHPTAFVLLCQGLGGAARDAALKGLGAGVGALAADSEGLLLQALGGNGVPREAWLERCLDDDDLELRAGALLAASVLGAAGLACAVCRAGAGPELAESAQRVLLRLAVPGAHALLEGSPPAIVGLPRAARAVAGEALLRLADPALVPGLVALLSVGEAELVELAVRALGRSRAQAAIAPLCDCLADDALAPHAARALVGLAGSFPSEVSQALEAQLGAALRPHTLRALARVAPAQAQRWIELGARDAVDLVRAAAIESVGELSGAALLDSAAALGAGGASLLQRAAADESPRVRRAALKAFARLRAVGAEAVLTQGLEDPQAQVAVAAIEGAAALRLVALVPALALRLDSPSGALALAALQALFQLGALSAPLLQRAAQHGDVEVLKEAVGLGAALPEGLALAVRALAHRSWDVRVAGARALAASGGRSALLPLHAALEREADPMARQLMMAAAATLAQR